MYRRLVAPPVLASVLLVGDLRAQGALTCPDSPQANADSVCRVTVRGDRAYLPLKLVGVSPASGHRLDVRSTRARVEARDTSDAAGRLVIAWTAADTAMNGPDTVLASVAGRVDVPLRRFVVTRPAPPSVVEIDKLYPDVPAGRAGTRTTPLAFGDYQTWYIDRQLGGPVLVEVRNVSAAECGQVTVLFKAIGDGNTTPDTVRADYTASKRCVAAARWRLGKTVGDQHLRASLAANPRQQVTFIARARNLPWIAAGLAYTRQSGYRSVSRTSRTATVVTKTTDTTETSETVTSSTTAASAVDGAWGFRPTLGVNTPIRTSWHRLRVSVSVDAQNAADGWFAGFSIPQLWKRLHYEDMNIDLHVVAQVRRREHLLNYDQCRAGTEACRTERRSRIDGVGAMVQINASSFLTSVLGLFPK